MAHLTSDLTAARTHLQLLLAEAERYGMSRAAKDRLTGALPIIDAIEAEREKRS